MKKFERTFWLERCYDEKNWVYLFQVTTGGRQNQNHIGPPGGQNPGYAPVLGPLLFLIYANDIEMSSSKLDFIMYADDTTLFYTQPDLNDMNENINSELLHVSRWFKANNLVVNIDKSSFNLLP